MLYQVYCKILSNVIRVAKRVYYDKKIKKSSKKYKTNCDIIKKLTNNQHSQISIQGLTIDSNHLKDQQGIADTFNNYFSSIIDKISNNNVNKLIMKRFLLSITIQNKIMFIHPHLWLSKHFQPTKSFL